MRLVTNKELLITLKKGLQWKSVVSLGDVQRTENVGRHERLGYLLSLYLCGGGMCLSGWDIYVVFISVCLYG